MTLPPSQPSAEQPKPRHAFVPVRGHADDDECTYRTARDIDADRWSSYCGLSEAAHRWSQR